MADNYLERRYDEVFGGKKSAGHPVSRDCICRMSLWQCWQSENLPKPSN